MTEPQAFDPREYGRLLGEAERARQRQSAAMWAEMSTAAGRAGHQAVSSDLRAAHEGLFPGASGQELAAGVAERPARVGDGVGAGRDLQRQGATYDWRDVSDSPAPAMVDLRHIGQPAGRPTGPSGLKAYVDGQR